MVKSQRVRAEPWILVHRTKSADRLLSISGRRTTLSFVRHCYAGRPALRLLTRTAKERRRRQRLLLVTGRPSDHPFVESSLMSPTPPATVIFGGTGQIGSALLRSLQPLAIEGALELRLAVRSPARASTLAACMHAKIFHVDLDGSGEEDAECFDGAATMFLLTGYSVAMLAQSKRAIDMAVRAGVRHIVHLGAHSADDTTNAHLGWHQFVEKYIERCGSTWTHLRPNWLMQNVLRAIRAEDDGLVLSNCLPPERRVSWVDANDVGTAAAAVVANPAAHLGKTYGLAVEARSMGEIAEFIASATNTPCRYEELDLDTFRSAKLKVDGDPQYQASALHYHAEVRAGRMPECEDLFDIEALLGRPPVHWPEFARANASHWRR